VTVTVTVTVTGLVSGSGQRHAGELAGRDGWVDGCSGVSVVAG
jgi:hypothetical protein